MKKFISTILFIIATSFTSMFAFSFATAPFPLLDQLPSSTVQRIFQDSEGFIWMGTLDGLCRYDGYRVITFRSSINNPNILENNEITSLGEDNNGFIWIGTRSGLNILDKKSYQIRKIDHPDVNNIEIRAIHTNSDGSILVGTFRKVLRFNNKHQLIKSYEDSIPISSVNSIYEDKEGEIWVTTWHNGIFKLNKENDTFEKLPPIGSKNNPFQLIQDKNKNIWVGTWGDGIFLLKKQGESYQYVPAQPESVKEKNFFSVVEDDTNGYLWFLSLSGLYAFEVDGRELMQIDTAHSMRNMNNIFSELITDNQNNIWLATFSEGAHTISFKKSVIENITLEAIKTRTGFTPNITTIYEDDKNNIWLNQNRYGLIILNPKTNQLLYHSDMPEIADLPGIEIVKAISGFRSIPNEIWVAPATEKIYSFQKEGDNLYLKRSFDLTELTSNSGLPQKFFEDRNNNIWIISENKFFLKPFNSDRLVLLDLPIVSVTGITEDVKGNIWISTSFSGIYKVTLPGNNPDNISFTYYNRNNSTLTSNNIEAIYDDKNGNIWIGTQEGSILAYDILTESFTDLTGSFKKINESILNIIADDYGHIWVTTNKRVIEYNPVNRAYNEYSTKVMNVNSLMKNSFFNNNHGELFFGGNNGIVKLKSSSKLTGEPQPILVKITDIKVNNISVFSENNNKRFDVLNQTVTLDPKDKNIEFSFSTLNYLNADRIQYAYKLEGVDNDWVYAETDRQFAVYNRLKKGTYKFQLTATDENGMWSSMTTQIKIKKRPAFYESGWAYLIYFLLSLATLYLVSHILYNRIQLRNKLRIAKIEKDKSEELTQSKLRYFTNISHDFMTPLTIVSCLIDDIELTQENKEIPQLDTMRSNVKRLRRLLQQVLDFRKIESGNMRLKLNQGDIVDFIRDISVINFEPLMRNKNLNFTFTSNREEMQAVFDSDKIDKIMFNLLSNAVKFTPNEGLISVNLNFDDADEWMTLTVEDSGRGIAISDQEKIFSRFYTDSKDRDIESNGIGLSLTRDLVELHNGSISFESEPNKGTRFFIDIPIVKEMYDSIYFSQSQTTSNSKDSDNKSSDYDTIPDEFMDFDEDSIELGKEHSILLVEDNLELLSVVQKILGRKYIVHTATNGKEGLKIVEGYNIDLIISDVMMPEMDGLEMTRQLKGNLDTSHIPILLLTAKSSAEDRVACYKAGANGYISKPFDLKVLEARIDNFILNQKNKQIEFKSNVDINISSLDFSSADEVFIEDAVKIIESNLTNYDLNVNVFADELNISKSSLYRKLKAMTGLSPNEFIRNIRLKHACQILKNQSTSISEVAYSVGFSDPKYFSLCFKHEFDMTPTEFQRSFLENADDDASTNLHEGVDD